MISKTSFNKLMQMLVLYGSLLLCLAQLAWSGDFIREGDDIYPQFRYKPYSYELYAKYRRTRNDCNRDFYPEYIEYIRSIRRNWTELQYVEPGYINNTVWEDYGRYEVSGSSSGPTKKQPCCWEFRRFPRRNPLQEYKKGRVRKEYRQLSDDERNSLHAAWQAMKAAGDYDDFTSRHHPSISPNAHSGAAFLPWHREFLFRMENALIDFGYTGPGLPYWDSTLDQGLPQPADSAIWTEDYLGNIDGIVTTGFAAFWDSIDDCSARGATLRRDGNQGPNGRCQLFDDFDLDYVYKKRCFRDIVCINDCKFENDHGGAHGFVGGHMGNIECSPSDPVFYMHHAFIDCVWERFRQKFQESNIFREYPNPINGDDIGDPEDHGYDRPMSPFKPLLNGHGIGKFYQKHYKCQRRPIHCRACKGDLLWCNKGRCMGKVREGGDCTGLEEDAACYCKTGTPSCNNNECVCTKVG